MAMITNDWLTALGGEFHKPYYRQLFEFVKNEYEHHRGLSHRRMIFSMHFI